ncbi:MAG: TonB-dependent receptor [Alphaproteobacteria bacterium]|nr:TonB-dependent receptor [Alphaproteobacteria bacterium]
MLDPIPSRQGKWPRALAFSFATVVGALLAAAAADKAGAVATHEADALADMSIEDLLKVEITIASKKSEQLASVPAAIYVITADEIARSSATTLADLLRMVPGLEVASLDGNKWAVSARGSNERFARRLLVLQDGRTLYSPLYSGVFWDSSDLVLDNISRIEVIRGPGASIWGANAVNGVVNVITKSAAETKGVYAKAEASDHGDQIYSARYGAAHGDLVDYNLSMKFRTHPDSDATANANDAWQAFRFSARTDWKLPDGGKLTVSGGFLDGTVETRRPVVLLAPPYASVVNSEDNVLGGHLLARWEAPKSDRMGWSVQGFWEKTSREYLDGELNYDVFDVELQSAFRLTDSTQAVMGAGYRIVFDEVAGSSSLMIRDYNAERDLISAFVQIDQGLFSNGTRLILGTKIENNDFTGTEIQPTARLMVPVGRFNLWAGVSRAVRTPSRGELDAITPLAVVPPGTPQNPGFLPLLVEFEGAAALDSEVLTAYEAGVRGRLTDEIWIDATAFLNEYNDTVDGQLGANRVDLLAAIPHVVQPINLTNSGGLEVKGFEVVLDWEPTSALGLRGFYGYLDENRDTASLAILQGAARGGNDAPIHQAGLRVSARLADGVDFTAMSKYVGEIEGQNLKDYVDLDLKLAWRVCERATVSITGNNLIDAPRTEFRSSDLPLFETEVERSVFGGIEVRF